MHRFPRPQLADDRQRTSNRRETAGGEQIAADVLGHLQDSAARVEDNALTGTDRSGEAQYVSRSSIDGSQGEANCGKSASFSSTQPCTAEGRGSIACAGAPNARKRTSAI